MYDRSGRFATIPVHCPRASRVALSLLQDLSLLVFRHKGSGAYFSYWCPPPTLNLASLPASNVGPKAPLSLNDDSASGF